LSTAQIHLADLEPFELGRRTYTTRRLGRFDAVTMLCVMIGLLTLIPEQEVLPGASIPGRPALILCLLMFAWWMFARLSPWLPLNGRQPIRWALAFFLLSNLVSYALGFLRGLSPMEANSSDSWMIILVELTGVVLIAADGIATWGRLNTLLKFFLFCCSVMSVIAVVQYVAYLDVTTFLYLPGLGTKGIVNGLQLRGTEVRAAATAVHYIELSTILAIAFPFAVHFARFASTPKSRRVWGGVALLLLAGNLVTLSRTGMVAIVIAILPMLPLWNWRSRYNTFFVGLIALVGLAIVKPGMARTAYELFAGAGSDDSITSRTDRYGMVGYYFTQRPWFGRGSGTWVSPQYQFLDNSWLATALTNGVFGVVALAGLFITGIVLASIALRRASNPQDKHLCAVLIGVQLITIFATYTYDSMYFTTGTVIIFLMTALCATVWRLTHPELTLRTAAPRRTEPRPVWRA
jgi:O-antigen ligase